MKPPYKNNISSIAELTKTILDPMMRKRVGLNMALLESWSAIVGSDYAHQSMPLKIQWPQNSSGNHDNFDFKPGTLIVACEGMAALKLSHETTQVLSRINSFFGYFAIEKIKIKQMPLGLEPHYKKNDIVIDEQQQSWLCDETNDIADKGLRKALMELGKSVLSDANLSKK